MGILPFLALLGCLAPTVAQYLPGGEWVTTSTWEPNPYFHQSWSTAMAGGVDVNGDGWSDLLTTDYDGQYYWLRVGHARMWSGRDGTLLWSTHFHPAEEFGKAACVLGDLDGDRVPEFAISDVERLNSYRTEGAVWVLSGRTGIAIREVHAKDFDEWFGASIASAGDVDRDGRDDFVVGVPDARSGRTHAGELRVFSGATGLPILVCKSPVPDALDNLGQAVLGPGDLDGDGVPDLVGGSPYTRRDLTGYAPGAVFAFSGRTGGLLWRHDGTELGQSLGGALARIHDLDHDGAPDLAVGADYLYQFDPGRVIFLSGRTGAVLHEVRGMVPGEKFGSSLLAIPDQDGDGRDDLAVGIRALAHPVGSGGIALVSSATGVVLERVVGSPSPMAIARHFSYLPAWGPERRAALASTGTERVNNIYLNSITILQREPYLRLDQEALSVSLGGTAILDLQFPLHQARAEYLIAGTLSGSGISQLLGIAVPLVADSFTHRMLLGQVPGFTGRYGRLDPAAAATVIWQLPAGAPSSLVGRTASFCAITLENFLGQLSSLPVHLQLDP